MEPQPGAPETTLKRALPEIIQGGMGIAVSNWKLAHAVSSMGQLGVVSGTAIDSVFVRRLQDGDLGGHVRRAMEAFPIPGVAAEALRKYFRPEGRPPGTPYAMLPMCQQVMTKAREQVAILAAFVEVHLAKEGHDGVVGMNLLTKIQMPNLPLLYGAMLAGVDFILMGAGIPREIPGVLDALALHQPAQLRLEVEGAPADRVEYLRFEPAAHWDGTPPAIKRPDFLPIIASNSLATMLVRKASGRVDGFVIEGPTAGGHNAPPRGGMKTENGAEPSYGPRDEVDLTEIAKLGLPFWVAGGGGSPEKLREVQKLGATGVQVGTLFAYCDESGIEDGLRAKVLFHASKHDITVKTDWRASPTGYPFKVVSWGGEGGSQVKRERCCDLGYLRTAYAMPDGRIGYRCASEPIDTYLAKGGDMAETTGRSCLCNALLSVIGQPQPREDGEVEPPILTSGDDLLNIGVMMQGRVHYSAGDVVSYLLGKERA